MEQYSNIEEVDIGYHLNEPPKYPLRLVIVVVYVIHHLPAYGADLLVLKPIEEALQVELMSTGQCSRDNQFLYCMHIIWNTSWHIVQISSTSIRLGSVRGKNTSKFIWIFWDFMYKS